MKQIIDIAAKELPERLLDWYDRHRRDLPWRAKAGEKADPYRVWLSEIMLQQTTVATVKDYFLHFVSRWPNVQSLAAAPLDDVLTKWAGLGYYARARNLHKCAIVVSDVFDGLFPCTEAELITLPGIGRYTAAAIASIAFNQPATVVDGNVDRVISRIFAIDTPLPDSKPLIYEKADSLSPNDRPGDYAQAIMDLGATICSPKNPKCMLCPWTDACLARKAGLEQKLPRKKAKKPRPQRFGTAFWLERKTDKGIIEVLLRRRPESGLLGEMMEIPSSPWDEEPETGAAFDHAPAYVDWRPVDVQVSHVFTHFALALNVFRGDLTSGKVVDGVWVPVDKLSGQALPTVMKKVVKAVLA